MVEQLANAFQLMTVEGFKRFLTQFVHNFDGCSNSRKMTLIQEINDSDDKQYLLARATQLLSTK